MKTMKIISQFLYFLLLSFNYNVQAQTTYDVLWDKTYGGTSYEGPGISGLNFSNVIIRRQDNEIYLMGKSISDSSGNKIQNRCQSQLAQPWLIKMDTAGNIIWQRQVCTGLFSDFIITSKGHLLLALSSWANIGYDKSENSRNNSDDYWVLMLDTAGNKIWDKTIGSYGSDAWPKLVELTTGEFVICGISEDTLGGGAEKTVANWGGSDYWAVKIDTLGNKIWDKVFGGIGDENFNTVNSIPTLAATTDGGFILAGNTWSPASGNISGAFMGHLDIWVMKADSAGNIVWEKRMGGSDYDDMIDIAPTSDGGSIFCALTVSPPSSTISGPPISPHLAPDQWVVKLDSLGNKQWDKRYGSKSGLRVAQIQQTTDGNFWVCGSTQSDSGLDVGHPSLGSWDYWVLNIDQVGNKIADWRLGGSKIEKSASFIFLPDSSIIVAGCGETGSSSPLRSDTGYGLSDFWLIKFRYGYWPVGFTDPALVESELLLYPNPTSNLFTLSSNQYLINSIELYNVLGEKVLEQHNLKTREVKLDVTALPPGIYFVKVFTEKGMVTKKLVKE
jgi:hypothetical protein